MIVTIRQALNRALGDALEADPDVFIVGEDVAGNGGVFKVTDGLLDRFGADRIYDTPISEQAIIGCSIGAALSGLRPVAEIMFADFAAVCFDQLVNQMAKIRYMSGGQTGLPVTVRMANGGGGAFAAQHSQTGEHWFLNTPGLKLVAPSNPADAYGLMRAAIADPNPVLFFEHKSMYNDKGELPEDPQVVEIGRAAIVRPGESATVVASQAMVGKALEAAEQLAQRGVSLEVIDLRTIAPLDYETVGASVDRTNNLIAVQEAPVGGSWASTLVTEIVGRHFESLDSAPAVVASDDTPVPFGEAMERAWLPDADAIVSAAERLLKV
ncbi:MAG TPA: alpha-ketoacid dehydrogenase subunit beta [Solirubrobacteraceae bacterium]|jgi:pyruvate dehydrogenase E1 component beta subunit|nr:alpha-ketoacid dehydrogenase subunit beta [Solirubrobacteraceae bacterium]